MYKESDCPRSNQTTIIIVLYLIKLIPINYANLVLRKLAVEAWSNYAQQKGIHGSPTVIWETTSAARTGECASGVYFLSYQSGMVPYLLS